MKAPFIAVSISKLYLLLNAKISLEIFEHSLHIPTRMKNLALLAFILLLPPLYSATDDSEPKLSNSQVRKDSPEDQGPNWVFYSAVGIAFMGMYYGLKKIVLEIGGDSGK